MTAVVLQRSDAEPRTARGAAARHSATSWAGLRCALRRTWSAVRASIEDGAPVAFAARRASR